MRKSCINCSAAFEITDEDLAFYDSVSPTFAGKKYLVPSPKKCPSCRYQQRLTWRNERTLYRRTCSATGEDIVSIFSSDKQWPPVYKQDYWWSDKWDPKSYGRDVDFTRPFFEQFAELWREVPQIAMNNQKSENCEYTNQSQGNKDCYMVTCTGECRDCLYSMWVNTCNSCVDSLYTQYGELCYEVINTKKCYSCAFSMNLESCSDTYFSRDCIGCRNCFGCVNMRSKSYCYFNEQLSKEEYEKRFAEAALHTHSGVEKAKKKLREFALSFPCKEYNGSNTFDSSGDYIQRTQNAQHCFNCRDAENIRYCQDAWYERNNYDLTETVENDFSYSLEGCGPSVNSLFCKKFTNCNNSLYCSHTNFSNNLFGCVSLNHAEYCILNKQYSKVEYEELAGKLIDHMMETGEWGEHFPSQYSPFGYNETVAIEYFPLTKEEAIGQGRNWKEQSDDVSDIEKIIDAAELPESIDDIPDDILRWAIRCEATGRPFRIIKQELDFCRKLRLPVPRVHPDERHKRRMDARNPRKLWTRTCDKCQKEIQTSYSPDRPETVYCEECYLQEVY